MNPSKIFSLEYKRIFVVGGSGLIGKYVCNLLINLGAIVYNLDKEKNRFLDKKVKFIYFDVSKKKFIEKNLKEIFKKYKVPECLINCSYPVSKNWAQSSFKSVSQELISTNLNLHLNTYIWIARIVAEEMRKKKIKGSIIQFGSHYGVIGQNTDLYKGTKMRENMIYSAIKGGIISNTILYKTWKSRGVALKSPSR